MSEFTFVDPARATRGGPVSATRAPVSAPSRAVFPSGGSPVATQPLLASNVLPRHLAALQALGVSSLSEIGTLRFDFGGTERVAVQRGGTALLGGATLTASSRQALSHSATRCTGPNQFEEITGAAHVLDSSIKRSAQAAGPTGQTGGRMASPIPMDVAYWFADEIVLEDDTTVVIGSEVKSLFVIANKLTIGHRVTFSWERPAIPSGPRPAKPVTPPKKPKATSVGTEAGAAGAPGMVPPTQPTTGQPAPELELWFLEANAFPSIDLRGQNGAIGIQGGDGGDGGAGQDGCDTATNHGFCSQGNGSGGQGGAGGRAGDGGRGGMGGAGGRFSVCTPQETMNAWLNSFCISVDGGAAGSGGDPGMPGRGGPGGAKGAHNHVQCPDRGSNGVAGNDGAPGVRGPQGQAGAMSLDPIKFSPITASDFNIQLNKPAIVSAAPAAAFVGDTVTVVGLRFSQGDTIWIEGADGLTNVACATTFVADTTLRFVVPAVPGGYAMFEVHQVDGTHSANKGTLIIRPHLDAVVPSGRVRPGQYYYLKGTGFGRSGNVFIAGEGVSPFEVVDINTIKFKARRPSTIHDDPSKAAGEQASLWVVNDEGAGVGSANQSNAIPITLDTFRILAFGDSVMWGGGLPEHLKFYSLAGDYLASSLDRIGVYKTILAHHGAKIGRGDTTSTYPMPGELSSRYPTISQQVDSLSSMPDAAEVDLVLVDGGANDLPITNFTLQTSEEEVDARIADLITKTNTYCYDDMSWLLRKIAAQFPSAQILVTAYYRIFSAQSAMPNMSAVFTGLMDGDAMPDLPRNVKDRLTRISEAFVNTANPCLARAVADVNDSIPGDRRIFFVDPQTDASHAAYAPNSLLWQPDLLGGPTDPMWDACRRDQREAFASRLQGESSSLHVFLLNSGYKMSKGNSSFHPNPAGAQRYFDKMKPVLDTFAQARRVSLRCGSGSYVCAVGGGGGGLVADRHDLGSWETFELVNLPGNRVALRSLLNNYVSADNSVGAPVVLSKTRVGPGELLEPVPQTAPNTCAFRCANGGFLSAAGSNGGAVTTAQQIGANEVFQIC